MPVDKQRRDNVIASLLMMKGKFKTFSRDYDYIMSAIHLIEDYDKLVMELYEKLNEE